MVKEIRCYEDSSGKVHKTERDAHRAELAIWLAQTGAINEASAIQLAEHLARNAGELSKLLAQIVRLEPTDQPSREVLVA